MKELTIKEKLELKIHGLSELLKFANCPQELIDNPSLFYFKDGSEEDMQWAKNIEYKLKYEKCIAVIKRFDPGIIGMYDL